MNAQTKRTYDLDRDESGNDAIFNDDGDGYAADQTYQNGLHLSIL